MVCVNCEPSSDVTSARRVVDSGFSDVSTLVDDVACSTGVESTRKRFVGSGDGTGNEGGCGARIGICTAGVADSKGTGGLAVRCGRAGVLGVVFVARAALGGCSNFSRGLGVAGFGA